MWCPYAVQLYCTTICPCLCKHCQVRSPFPGHANFDNVIRNLEEIARLRIPYVDFTGGDPASWPGLPEALDLSNRLGIYSSLTVSGPQIRRRGVKFIGLPSLLRFSIDGIPEFHDRNRGEGCFDDLIYGLELAQKLRGSKKTQLIFTAIGGNHGNMDVETLSFILDLARTYGVMVNVNFLFNAFLSNETLDLLSWFGRQADVKCSKGQVRFILRGGNNTLDPTCRAVSSTLAITADNRLALPCYHNAEQYLSLDGGIASALLSREWKDAQRREGRYPFCRGCSVWCYILPSWVMMPDRLVTWLHALSGFQSIRDSALKSIGSRRSDYPYPAFRKPEL